MSYTSREQSVALARPKILIDFEDGNLNHWRYNSSTVAVSHIGDSYVADVCRVGELEISGEEFRNIMKIELSRQNAFAWQYISGPLESEVTVSIYRLLDSDYVLWWSGVVIDVNHDTHAIPTVKCAPLTSGTSRLGWRRRSHLMCDLELYGQGHGGCKVNKASFTMTGVIATVSGTTLSGSDLAAQPDGWLQGGEIVIGTAHRLIKSHTVYSAGMGEVIINRQILNPEVDSGGNINFTAYAGCDHLPTTCDTKFSNKINFGGQEYLPVKNPFAESGVT
jgi:hypothetical protein